MNKRLSELYEKFGVEILSVYFHSSQLTIRKYIDIGIPDKIKLQFGEVEKIGDMEFRNKVVERFRLMVEAK